MASNLGTFRDIVTVYYELSETTTDMGSRSMTYTTYEEPADVRQLDSNVAIRYGLNVMSDNYSVKIRPPATGRPVLVLYGSTTYKVVSAQTDKVSQFMDLIITASR